MDIEAVGTGREALKYLTPYIFRVAISNKNILNVTETHVTFRYREGKTNVVKVLTLPAEQFISRFLQHVLPKGFQKVRSYGLYHPKSRGKLELVKEQLQPQEFTSATKVTTTKTPTAKPQVRFYCPCCKVEMIKIGKITPKRGPPI